MPTLSGSEGLLNLDEEELFFFMELIFKAEPILMDCLKKGLKSAYCMTVFKNILQTLLERR